MAELKLQHIYKRYGNVTAVGDFNIEVADGEFISFLGPSGCGKTTTLRMIAGFEKPTEGVITIGDQEISNAEKGYFLAPELRAASSRLMCTWLKDAAMVRTLMVIYLTR